MAGDADAPRQRYRYLTQIAAARRAAAEGDVRKAALCEGVCAEAAYAMGRAGFADACATSRQFFAYALLGAVDGGHAQLAQYLVRLSHYLTYLGSSTPIGQLTLQRCAWRAGARGLGLDFGPEYAMFALTAAGNYHAADATATAPPLPHELHVRDRRSIVNSRWQQIRAEAARHGDVRALRWAFSRTRMSAAFADIEAADILVYALGAGHGCPTTLTRLIRAPSYMRFYDTLLCAACDGGKMRGAIALLRLMVKAAPKHVITIAENLIRWACRRSSLRILALGASRIVPAALGRVLNGIQDRISSPCAFTSDARLGDALACAEFLLLYRRVPRFNRGRLLAFQAPRRAVHPRTAPCLTVAILSRISLGN